MAFTGAAIGIMPPSLTDEASPFVKIRLLFSGDSLLPPSCDLVNMRCQCAPGIETLSSSARCFISQQEKDPPIPTLSVKCAL
jgi:hypothetical protein